MKKYTRGFTLIELLVVIAIIGILASVVLVSLNSARSKGKDARIISDVQQIRTALESGYNGSAYPDIGVVNFSNNAANLTSNGPQSTVISTLTSDATSQGGSIIVKAIASSNGNGAATGYAIYGQLASNNSGYFCIDSVGNTAQQRTASSNSNCQ